MTSETQERVRSNLEAICGSRISVDQRSLTQLQDKLRTEQETNWQLQQELSAVKMKLAHYKREVELYYDEHAANHEAETRSQDERDEPRTDRPLDMGEAEGMETETVHAEDIPF